MHGDTILHGEADIRRKQNRKKYAESSNRLTYNADAQTNRNTDALKGAYVTDTRRPT